MPAALHDRRGRAGQPHRGLERQQLERRSAPAWTARVYALAVSGSTLYAGGDFTSAGGAPANHIAAWNGSSWSALGSGMDGYAVYALAVSGSTLYAGGDFTTAGGVPANHIAAWNGSSWTRRSAPA